MARKTRNVGTFLMMLPFPDVVQAQIIDVQATYLTADMQKQIPFLSHLVYLSTLT